MRQTTVLAVRCALLASLVLAMVACDPGEVLSVTFTEGDVTMFVGEHRHLPLRVETTGEARKTVAWSISDASVARIQRSKASWLGGVVALSAGVAQVTATSTVDRTKSDTVTVTVIGPPTPAVTAVTIDQRDAVLIVGAQVQLTATVRTTLGAPEGVIWSSDDTAVVDVDASSGMLRTAREGLAVITAASTFDPSFSDSIRITVTSTEPDVGAVTVTATTGGTYVSIANARLGAPAFAAGTRSLAFDVGWPESWRGPDRPTWVAADDNWDAVWVFGKFRLDGGAWHHMRLRPTGGASPAGATVRVPADGRGVFVHRDAPGYGSMQVEGVHVIWDYWADRAAVEAAVDVRLFAIEMVFVPEGPFALGSGGSSSYEFREGGTSNAPFVVARPGPISLGDGMGQLSWTRTAWSHRQPAGTTSESFPTGYAGFYVMKHQVTQGQYVGFLNTLTQAQAAERTHVTTHNRYSVVQDGDAYRTSLPYVALNYMSWADGAAFADWAGLRPMTELEFEKVARGPGTPVADEFAWGSTRVTRATGLAHAGSAEEVPVPDGANASYGARAFGNGIGGPLRVGSFAAPGRSREHAGAGYYGALDVSGNLWERVVSVEDQSGMGFSGAHGDGELDASGQATVPCWPNQWAVGVGQRGGSWWNIPDGMRVSHRGAATNVPSGRDWVYGWRGARSAP